MTKWIEVVTTWRAEYSVIAPVARAVARRDGLAPDEHPVGRRLLRARRADEPIRAEDLA